MALFDRDDAGGIIMIRCIMCGRDNYRVMIEMSGFEIQVMAQIKNGACQ